MLMKTLLTLLTFVNTHHVISYKNLFTFTFLMETHSVRLIAESHSLCIPETCTKRQTTRHGRLLRLLGVGDKGIKIVYGEEKNIL